MLSNLKMEGLLETNFGAVCGLKRWRERYCVLRDDKLVVWTKQGDTKSQFDLTTAKNIDFAFSKITHNQAAYDTGKTELFGCLGKRKDQEGTVVRCVVTINTETSGKVQLRITYARECHRWCNELIKYTNRGNKTVESNEEDGLAVKNDVEQRVNMVEQAMELRRLAGFLKQCRKTNIAVQNQSPPTSISISISITPTPSPNSAVCREISVQMSATQDVSAEMDATQTTQEETCGKRVWERGSVTCRSECSLASRAPTLPSQPPPEITRTDSQVDSGASGKTVVYHDSSLSKISNAQSSAEKEPSFKVIFKNRSEELSAEAEQQCSSMVLPADVDASADNSALQLNDSYPSFVYPKLPDRSFYAEKAGNSGDMAGRDETREVVCETGENPDQARQTTAEPEQPTKSVPPPVAPKPKIGLVSQFPRAHGVSVQREPCSWCRNVHEPNPYRPFGGCCMQRTPVTQMKCPFSPPPSTNQQKLMHPF